MAISYEHRHQLIYDGLRAIPGVECHPADGTFYIFPNVKKIIERLPNIHSDIELAELLLNKAGLAVIPGSAFGDPECIRLSFATSSEIIQKALVRFADVVR
jgi:aspartate aminotransferase